MAKLSMDEFAEYVRRVLETLPDLLKPHVQNLVVDVENEVDASTRKRLDLADNEDLFGLYIPFPIDQMNLDWNEKADRLVIYRRPHIEAFASRQRVLIEVRKTVIHELAHHFGYTDKDLEAFDRKNNPFPDSLKEQPHE